MLLPELRELNDAYSLSLPLLLYISFLGKKRLRNCNLKGREKKKSILQKRNCSLTFMDFVD